MALGRYAPRFIRAAAVREGSSFPGRLRHGRDHGACGGDGGASRQHCPNAVKAAGAAYSELSDKVEAETGKVAISTMHLAQGLEFRAVAVMACDVEVLPLQERIERVTDESDLEEVYDTERHLLYMACTRARDRLLISGIDPASEFLDDLAS
jgi:superfamily I DNA/RNA helicase